MKFLWRQTVGIFPPTLLQIYTALFQHSVTSLRQNLLLFRTVIHLYGAMSPRTIAATVIQKAQPRLKCKVGHILFVCV